MAFAEGPTDSGPRLDGLGTLYLSLAIIWTGLLVAAISFLILNRRVQCVQVRNLPLSIGAVSCLHLYAFVAMNCINFNGYFPCSAEYWIMSIYLPFGTALFQASNVQLVSVYNSQNRLLAQSHDLNIKLRPLDKSRARGIWRRYRTASLLTKTYCAIAIGMIVQLIVSTSVFLTSRKFVPFGIFSQHVDPVSCRRGTEWIPSTLWQLLWAWCFGPYILYTIRHIKDVHKWRLQTFVCIVASLPASPMWLIALYANTAAFGHINNYFAPPQWYAISIMAMQAVTIFVPCFEVIQSRHRQKYVRRVLRDWEIRRLGGEEKSLASSTPSSTASKKTASSSLRSCHSGMYSKLSFEKYITGDSTQLLTFAASREFTGENIIFMNYVRDWKASWGHMHQAQQNESDPDIARYRLHFFKVAVEIYADYVDLRTAEFPVNIESSIYVQLAKVFGSAARLLNRPVSDCDFERPFVLKHGTAIPLSETSSTLNEKLPSTTIENAMQSTTQAKKYGTNISVMTLEPRLPDVGVPEDFGPDVFDKALESVMHMVYLNTWPRFVDVTIEEFNLQNDTEGVPTGKLNCFR